MRKQALASALGLAVAVTLSIAQPASAAVGVGDGCEGNGFFEKATLVQIANGAGEPLPAAAPAGVITAWTVKRKTAVGLPSSVAIEQKLKVFRPVTGSKQLLVTAESALGLIELGTNTFPARIPVAAGDRVGLTGLAKSGGSSVTGTLGCETGRAGDRIAVFDGDPGLGSSSAPKGEETDNFAIPVIATVEADADGDGFGDESQDGCPTAASSQGACPPPGPIAATPTAPSPAPPSTSGPALVTPSAAPITLSGSAVAKSGLVTATVTSSAQANVTVGGSVKVGRGMPASVRGGTQIVTPGKLAKFVVLLPAKVKEALVTLPTARKLTVSLSASAPGATTAHFAVRVRGEKKPAPKHRGR